MARLILFRSAMRCLTLGTLATLAFTSVFASAGEWHVAPSGNDAADGSLHRPFATLERAVEAARLARQKESPTTNHLPATIRIQGGLHPRSTTLELDARDSFLRILGSAEPRATLHAGRFIERAAFHPITNQSLRNRLDPAARGHVVALDLSAAGISHIGPYPDTFRDGGGIIDLYWKDQPLPVARWPNDEPTTMQKVLDRGDWSRGPSRRPGAFVAREDRLTRWNVADGLWLEGYWRVPWEPHMIRVDSIDPGTRTITFATPIFGGIGSKYAPKNSLGDGKEPWWAVNLLEEIDRPGEWCIHFPTRTLYLWPPEGWDDDAAVPLFIADLKVPLIRIDGAEEITIAGLALEGGLGDGIVIDGGRGNRIAGCTIRNLADNGIIVRGGNDHAIESCDLHTLGAAGIRLSGGDRATLTPCGHRAINNHIFDVGRRQKTGAAGIHVGEFREAAAGGGDAVGCRVAHNLIHDLPHAAVLYTGNDNVFEDNEICRVALTSRDVGAFYTRYDWTSQGNVLRHNFVHSSPRANAFYIDDGDSGDTVEGNVVFRCACGPFLGGGHDNTVQNNVVIDCDIGIHFDARGVARGYATNDVLRRRLASIDASKQPWGSRYPHLARLATVDAGLPHGNLIAGNAAIDCQKPLRVGGTAEQLADNTIEEPLTMPLAEAGFTDPGRLDFSLPKQSALQARVPDFKAIPFDRIGLRKDTFRKTLPTQAVRLAQSNSRTVTDSLASATDLEASNKQTRSAPATAVVRKETNYDETRVRPYTLPDALAGPDGTPAASPEAWRTIARPHQLSLLEKNVYGTRLPPAFTFPVGEVERAEVTLADGVKATRLQARLRMGQAKEAPLVDVLLYLPTTGGPSPVFLNLNFKGNQAEHPDPGIRLSQAWLADDEKNGIVNNRATEASRGVYARRWPVETMLARGYGMATACYGDIFPDRPDGRADSVLAALGRPVAGDLPADEPGAIAAWAWGLSRILDWLIRLPEVDPTRVIVVGHSRNGKAALWAGACDERFAMVVSNESGCGGAALERRNYGETIADITTRFPHWFCPAFATYAGREDQLPTDAHTLLAMAAPRPLYVASAIDDRWADPRGEFLAAAAAEPVWKRFGLTGLGTAEWPPVDTPVGSRIGYHVRSGKHDLLEYDWLRFADFADKQLPAVHTRRGEDAAAPFQPVQNPLPVPPPPGAIVLFGNGREGPPQFTSMAGGPIDWTVNDGSLVVNTTKGHANHIVSTVNFEDAHIHAEFMISPEAHGNSGLYIHGHYEMQIYDSFGTEPPTDQDEGALYRFGKPLVNASRPAGEWQVYDIRFIAPRRDAAGRITRAGSITAWLNGQLVQDGITFTEPRSPFIPYRHGATDFLRGVEKTLRSTGSGPLFLQDHGSPTRFRNVWIKPLRSGA
jgi:hypothetical protein